METIEENTEDIENTFNELAVGDDSNQAQIFQTTDLKQFDRRFLSAVNQAMQDPSTPQELVRSASQSFSHILHLANNVPNRQFAKELSIPAQSLKQKINSLASEGAERTELLNKVLQTLIIEFSPITESYENQGFRLLSNGGQAVLSLLQSFFAKEQLKYSTEIVKIFLAVAQSFSSLEVKLAKKSRAIFKIVQNLQGYDYENFKGTLKTIPQYIKYVFMGLLLKEKDDQDLKTILAKDFKEIVTNDKNIARETNFKYFAPFLNNINEEFFEKEIYPQIEFMMKRNGQIIPIVALTVRELKQVPINETTLPLFTTQILTDKFIMEDQLLALQCTDLFQELAKRINDPAVAKSLLIDYLLRKFTESRQSYLNATQRGYAIRHILKVLDELKTAADKSQLVSTDQRQLVCTALIDHVFFVKDEPVLKESFEDILHILLSCSDLQFINEAFKKNISKAAIFWQVTLVIQLILKSKQDLTETIKIVAPQFKQMLMKENFTSIINYSSILALTAFFCVAFQHTKDQAYIQWVVDNENVILYFAKNKGFVNTPAFFKKNPSIYDIKYHLLILQTLMDQHYTGHAPNVKVAQLRDTLFEYLLNDTIPFRQYDVFESFNKLSEAHPEKTSLNFLKTLKQKIKQASSMPIVYNREEYAFRHNVKISHRIKIALRFILKGIKSQLEKNDFFLLLKVICHPYVSPDQNTLSQNIKEVELVLKSQTKSLSQYLELYGPDLVNFAIIERTGILSPDPIVRLTAVNIATILGSYGQLSLFIEHFVQILNYKPFELATKLESVFRQEFDRISFYNLMYYADITRELLVVFKDKDHDIQQKEIGDEQSHDEEVKQSDDTKSKDIDPSKLASQMLKQQAALKKSQTVTKKGSSAAQKAPVKSTTTVKDKVQPKREISTTTIQTQSMDKEQRNKFNKEVLLNYFSQIQTIKARHVQTVLEIIKRINKQSTGSFSAEGAIQSENYLDITLKYLLQPMIKLLHFPAAKFVTINCATSLFGNNQQTPFFKVKNAIANSMVCMSQGRIYQKNQREFQQIFQHLEQKADLGSFGKGYLQLVLMMANFILKDLSVNLSVKELALSVTQSILDNNSEVENIDLVRLTINMMKSSYSNDNLSFYLKKLLKKITISELALMLQRIFEYEPIPRQKFLQEVLTYEEPLFCPVWLSTQVWVLQFDEDQANLARKLWNKYGFVLRSGVIDLQKEDEYKNVFFYLRSKNTQVFDASVKATVAAIELFQNRYDLIIDDLIEFYDKEMTIIEHISFTSMQASQNQLIDTKFHKDTTNASKNVASEERINRIAVPEILKRTAHLVQANSFKKIFDFFITKGCLDQSEQVSKVSMSAALSIIQTKGSDYAEDILKILEKYINDQKKHSEQSKNQAIIMIGSLAIYLDNTSQKKLIVTFEKMLELLNTPSEMMRQSICKCIPQIARFFDDRSRKFLEEHFTILRKSDDEKLLRGSAYAVAGISKGLGMQVFDSYDILNIIQKECFSSKNTPPLRKQAGLYLYEALFFSLGRSFEMHLTTILPNIQACIADQKEQVRRAANQANKVIMASFSNFAIKKVLPIFLQGLATDQWRSKLASVEALGTMAYCAPKQISGYLPNIVKGVREVLNDTHEKVHAAALQAIQNIGSVIKCPEIADILEVLVKALSNPNAHLKDALNVLLETSFVHAIDAPSLSLLVPILDAGLMMHDNQVKQLAATLMGSICQLTQDSEDLLPYMKILMPSIQNSLFDSIPEIRASAAKAMGSLSRGLGMQNSLGILEQLRINLHEQNIESSKRSGAAQGFAEIISVHGTQFFEKTMIEVVKESSNEKGQVRESYRSVMVFLPTSFDQFVEYLPRLLPIMIEGLSDDTEEVRKVSLRNVKICIKQFGKIRPNQLVHPIMKMMFDQDFKVRASSSVLMYQLVKELENDIIKSQPKYIDEDTKNEILSSLFILKYDTIEKVSTQASQIWKNIIDNQLKVLKQILQILIKIVFNIIESDSFELQEMGLNCMRGLVEKFGEKLVSSAVDILETYLEGATTTSQIAAVSRAIYNMAAAAPTKLLGDMKNRFIGIMDQNLQNESEEIRLLSSKVFITVFSKVNETQYITSILDKSIHKKLHSYIVQNREQDAELLLWSLKDMLKSAPELRIDDKLINLCGVQNHEEPLTIAQAKLLTAVAPGVAKNIFKKKFYNTLLVTLLDELTVENIDDDVRINEVLIALSELLSNTNEDDQNQVNDQIVEFHAKCKKLNRMSFYVSLIAYFCRHSKNKYEAFADSYMRNVLVLMNEKDEKLIDKVNDCLNAIFDGLPKENQFYLVPLIREIIEEIAIEETGIDGIYRKKTDTLALFQKSSGVKSFVNVIQNSIMHGSIEVRIDSAKCFKYLIEFSKPEAIKSDIIKICGALIRVVNDKFTPNLKIQIFYALKLILLKASVAVKAMVPQLQTTFLKAYNDSSATIKVRKVVIDDLLLLIKITPKADPIVKELFSLLEGDKLENEAKVEVAEALALTIRFHGKAIQQTMSQQIYGVLVNILENKKYLFNDKTLINCAVALAFLSAYSSNSQQMESLFSAYDAMKDPRVNIGIKLGVLMNGNPDIDAPKLIKQVEAYLLEQVTNQSGLAEIDGKDVAEGSQALDLCKLSGAFDILGYIGDTFVRRFIQPTTSEMYEVFYRVINQSDVLKKLNTKSVLSKTTIRQVFNFFASIPVKPDNDGKLSQELALVLKDGFKFIKNTYLEVDSKKEAGPALLNMLLLNYDNFLDIDDNQKITPLTKASISQIAKSDMYQGITSDDMKTITAAEVINFWKSNQEKQ